MGILNLLDEKNHTFSDCQIVNFFTCSILTNGLDILWTKCIVIIIFARICDMVPQKSAVNIGRFPFGIKGIWILALMWYILVDLYIMVLKCMITEQLFDFYGETFRKTSYYRFILQIILTLLTIYIIRFFNCISIGAVKRSREQLQVGLLIFVLTLYKVFFFFHDHSFRFKVKPRWLFMTF